MLHIEDRARDFGSGTTAVAAAAAIGRAVAIEGIAASVLASTGSASHGAARHVGCMNWAERRFD